MLGYRKRSFDRAHTLLQALRADPEDLARLRQLQQLLLHEIIRAEEKIRELKTELKLIRQTANKLNERRSSYLKNRIEGYRQCTYVWRCFGDAIAFLYVDKFALKHCFYSTENTNVKQAAGFIAGKEGLANELMQLEFALHHNVPALLVDLTNTIRHGDICLMGASDPYLIEVKTSKKLDHRGKKQKRSLEKLHSFYETDKSDGLRGVPEVRRRASGMPERTHVNQINECIIEAQKDGFAVRQPEDGLHYIVMTQNAPRADQVVSSLALKEPWAFFLNQAKSDRSWAPYLPFILTIEDKHHLWDFIRGALIIVVMVEVGRLCQIAIEHGYDVKFDRNDAEYPLRVGIPPADGMAGISAHILARIGMEFVSPEWLVLSSIETIRLGAPLREECGDRPSA
jgi:hypothetical protein